MADDIRYSELRFLQSLPSGTSDVFNHQDSGWTELLGLNPRIFIEMVTTLIEELYVRLDDQNSHLLVGRLRGEVGGKFRPSGIHEHEWENPRDALEHLFLGNRLQRLRVTYRGLRRIEELREFLARDRIMEPFGVLLSIQYFRVDLEAALKGAGEVQVSVLYLDMDHFGPINKEFGHDAGDVVMKAYLEIVRDQVGIHGKAYRGRGDEVAVLIRGQGHERAVEFAEKIRRSVEAMKCNCEGHELPRVTTSIGVASAPPDGRTMDLETLAENRQRSAKEAGRNRVVAEN